MRTCKHLLNDICTIDMMPCTYSARVTPAGEVLEQCKNDQKREVIDSSKAN